MEHERRQRLFSLILLIAILWATVLTISALTGTDWLERASKKIQRDQPGLYSVSEFIDGDTISVNMNDNIEIVRMIGVDTPETHRPNTPVQCYGPEAAAFTKQFIGKQKVRLQADPLDTNRDRYNRLLRYVYLPDGQLVETALISGGYGFAYTSFPFTKAIEFSVLENQAKQAEKGLWGTCKVTVEENGREQTNPAN